MTSSNGNIFRVTGPLCGEFTGPGEFPTQRPVTRSFDVYFDLRLNKRLCKQSWGWWFETLLCPLWRHSNGILDKGKGWWSSSTAAVNTIENEYLFLISCIHYSDLIMTTMASQITSLTVVYLIVYSDADQQKHQSSASMEFTGHRWMPRTKGQ